MSRGKDMKIERLAEVSLFRSCTEKELKRIASIADEVELAAGHVLCHEGRTAYECFILDDGEAEVRIGDRVVARLGAGESVGEMALLNRQPRSATVVVTKPTRAYVIDGQRFGGLIEDNPHVARALLEELSTRLRALDAAFTAATSPTS